MEAIHPKYKTFWRRFWADIIDIIVLSPIGLFYYFAVGKYLSPPAYQLWSNVFLFVLVISYSIILTANYGGTLGKLAVEIRVLDAEDEISFIGVRQAIQREAPVIVGNIVGVTYMLATYNDNPEGFGENNMVLRIISSLSNIWFIAELITMFSNGRRRAIHDILANSVVVKRVKEEAIAE